MNEALPTYTDELAPTQVVCPPNTQRQVLSAVSERVLRILRKVEPIVWDELVQAWRVA